MRRRPHRRTCSTGIALALLILAAACGEFHTARFTDPRDTAPDTAPDVPPDAPRCTEFVALQLAEDRDPADLVVGVPFHRLLEEETGAADLWLVAAGALPPGLTLDPLTGALSGVSKEAGSGTFTVRVTADDEDDGTCYILDEAVVPWTLVPQCITDDDCGAQVSAGFLSAGGGARCDAGRCVATNGCPNDPRQRVRFLLGWLGTPPPPGPDGRLTGGEVILHARIKGQKNPEDLRRSALIVFEESDTVYLRLDYTLPDNWPLPLREGDPVSLRLESGAAGGEALEIEGPGGPARLLSGFWIPGGLPKELSLPALAALLPLDCPAYTDKCGDQVPAAATFQQEDSTWTLAPGAVTWTPDPLRPTAGAEALLGRLGWSAFRGDVLPTPVCAGSPPVELSALFLPADDCPGAVAKAESAQDQIAGPALAALPAFEVSGWASFSPDPQGAVVAATWTVEEDPLGLGGGFARLEVLPQALPDPVGLGSRRLRAGAVGDYRIGLTVKDHLGRESCITDTIRFRVFPDPEVALRAELVWLPWAPPGADGEDSLELYMRPVGSAAWEDPDRVCSPASPLPESFEGAQCAAADLPAGRPALATLKALAPTKTYGFALRAPEPNTAPMVNDGGTRIVLRLFCNTEQLEFALPDGFTLAPGDLVEVARIAPGCVVESLL